MVPEEQPGQEVWLSVTVPAPAVKRTFNETVERLAKDVVGSVKGFRKDKQLPLPMVVAQVGGEKRRRGRGGLLSGGAALLPAVFYFELGNQCIGPCEPAWTLLT